MSKKIAVVTEGKTDFIAIEAALKAVLTVPFVLNRLPGEEIIAGTGEGWGGVLKWCHSIANLASAGHFTRLNELPGLEGYDAIIIHLDADVARMSYQNYGNEVAALAVRNQWHILPCQQPTLAATLQNLQHLIASWLSPVRLATPQNLLCLPAQAMESWLAAAVLPLNHALLVNIENNTNLLAQLSVLKKNIRIKKDTLTYRQKAPVITKEWAKVKQVCSQAALFDTGCQQI